MELLQAPSLQPQQGGPLLSQNTGTGQGDAGRKEEPVLCPEPIMRMGWGVLGAGRHALLPRCWLNPPCADKVTPGPVLLPPVRCLSLVALLALFIVR